MKEFCDAIENKMREGSNYEDAFDYVFKTFCNLGLRSEADRNNVKNEVTSILAAKSTRDKSANSLCADNQDWFFFAEKNNKHWQHYKNHLTKHKKWKKSQIGRAHV